MTMLCVCQADNAQGCARSRKRTFSACPAELGTGFGPQRTCRLLCPKVFHIMRGATASERLNPCMKRFFSLSNFLGPVARILREAKSARALVAALSCLLIAAPVFRASDARRPSTNNERQRLASTQSDSRFDCGYNPRGADDEIHKHR